MDNEPSDITAGAASEGARKDREAAQRPASASGGASRAGTNLAQGVPVGDTLDEAALEALYVRLETPLYNVVYRYLWNAEDAAEVVQEAFVRLWKRRAKVRMDTVEPYVYRIAINLASKRRRWRKLREFIGLDKLGAREAEPPVAESTLLRAETRATVRAAVEALPEKHRRVVMMTEFTDMTYAEVGEVLEIPSGTVASRRSHALRKLRTMLSLDASEREET